MVDDSTSQEEAFDRINIEFRDIEGPRNRVNKHGKIFMSTQAIPQTIHIACDDRCEASCRTCDPMTIQPERSEKVDIHMILFSERWNAPIDAKKDLEKSGYKCELTNVYIKEFDSLEAARLHLQTLDTTEYLPCERKEFHWIPFVEDKETNYVSIATSFGYHLQKPENLVDNGMWYDVRHYREVQMHGGKVITLQCWRLHRSSWFYEPSKYTLHLYWYTVY